MSVNSIIAAQEAHRFISTDLKQAGSGRPLILQMPLDILNLLGSWVATGSDSRKRAGDSIRLGRVCIYTHLLSHSDEIGKIIDQEKIHLATHDLAKAILERTPIDQEKIHLATHGLAKAIFERSLSGPEMGLFKSLTGTSEFVTQNDKLNILYAVFREYALKYNIREDSDEFASQSITIQKNIQTLCMELGKSNPAFDIHFCLKTESVFRNFTGKTIGNMISKYANLPLAKIAIENFKEKALHLEDQFAEIKPDTLSQLDYHAFIESKMREAILTRHPAEEFDAIIGALFATAKNTLTTQLKEEKAILESADRIDSDRLAEIEFILRKIKQNDDILHEIDKGLDQFGAGGRDRFITAGKHGLVEIPGFNPEIVKIYQFYNELSNGELAEYSLARSRALHRIIG
jgi:hypothetical protein